MKQALKKELRSNCIIMVLNFIAAFIPLSSLAFRDPVVLKETTDLITSSGEVASVFAALSVTGMFFMNTFRYFLEVLVDILFYLLRRKFPEKFADKQDS